MSKITKKLLLMLSLAMVAMQSNAMWLRKPVLSALAKRSTILRAPAIARPHVVCNKAIMPYAKPQQAVMIRRSSSSLSTSQKATNKSYNGSASSIKRLVGTGVALGAVCATAQEASCEGDKAKDETPAVIYQGPFEESRKKFYKDLENKPWGEVSKKYIKALQEEEQKLMEEFFQIMQINKDAWERSKINTESVIDLLVRDYERIINISYTNVPKSLSSDFKELFEKSHINPESVKIGGVNVKEFHMEAFHNSIAIDCGVFSHYDPETFANRSYSFCPEFFRAVALHEIQHLLHHDSIHKQAFVRVLNDANDLVPLSEERNFLMLGHNVALKHGRFTEKRADICAGLVDPKYILAAAKRMATIRDSHDNISHPAYSERAVYLTQLHKEMTEAIAKKDAQSR